MLLGVAAQSIEHGLNQGSPLEPDPHDYPDALQAERATFVTLQIEGALRGCIGVLEAIRPLVVDVAHNAFAAAFEDPRFPPLTRAELPRLDIHISVLTRRSRCGSLGGRSARADPARHRRPDPRRSRAARNLPALGLGAVAGPRGLLRAPAPQGGPAVGYWSETLAVSRYTAESFGASIEETFGVGRFA
jgi:uncharacterized protein